MIPTSRVRVPAEPGIHRSLMARIAGFHPADPGSIPGDEDRLGMTLKAPKIAYSKKSKKIKIDTRSSPVRCRFARSVQHKALLAQHGRALDF